MVSWGMGHNLEKNLERARSLRAKGQLDRALKSLQGWAERHPDTPHYQFEAAMVAFELRDWSTGLGSLRSLMKDVPETREKVLGACREQFDDVPALPLGEFLIEQALTDRDLATANHLVNRLDEENRGIYLRKLGMRHRSMAASGNVASAKLLHSAVVQFLLACSLGDGEKARETVGTVAGDQTWPVSEWTALLDKALSVESQNVDLIVARAIALSAEGRVGPAGDALVHAARIKEQEIDACLEILHGIEPEEGQRGHWHLTEGHLRLLQKDAAATARAWTAAADADPKLRERILESLERPSENTELPGREDALKLRLRLLVVQKHFDSIPELARRLVAEGLADPGELRALLGEGQEAELPTEMKAVLAEIALRDRDLAAGARLAYEIPVSDEKACQRILKTIDAIAESWEEEDSRLQLHALRAVLRARIHDSNGANAALAEAWRTWPAEVETLRAVTDRCLESVEPLPGLVAAAGAALLDAGDPGWLREPFLKLCPESGSGSSSRDPAGGLNFAGDQGTFSQDALMLDLGGDDETSFAEELARAFLEVIREQPSRGRPFLDFFDGLKRPDLEPPFRQCIATAALHAGDTKRALPTFALLSMTADSGLLAAISDDYDRAITDAPENVDLLLSRAELHVDGGDLDSAAECLDRALRVDPARAGEIVEAYDRMLEGADEELRPRLQSSLAEALFETRCFDRLGALCSRALEETEGSAQVPWLRLKVRVATARGEFSAALQLIQQGSVKGPMPPDIGAELLEEVLEVHPGSAISWLMLGQLSTQAGRLARALDAYVEAMRLDATLEKPVAEQIHEISNDPDVDADLLIAVAAFHLGRDAADRAAHAFGRALDRDAGKADRILGELETRIGREDCPPDLLAVAARSCRHAGQPERATQLLLRVHSASSRHQDTVLSELHHLRECSPDLLLPARCMADVMWEAGSKEAATRVAIDTARDDRYPLRDRIEFLGDFHDRDPGHVGLTLSRAALLAEDGDRSAACALIESARAKDGFDADLAVEVTSTLHRQTPEHAGVALLHHDLLARAGRIDEALAALPAAAALRDDELDAVSERFEAHRAQTLGDPALCLRWTGVLVRAGREKEALAAFEEASRKGVADGHPLTLEWARLLHHTGDAARSAAVLNQWTDDPERSREAFAAFGRWNAEQADSAIEALRCRLAENPEDLQCALEMADTLLDVERAVEARELLGPLEGDDEFRFRRAVRLGRAHLLLDRAEDAEAILLDVVGDASKDHEDFGEVQYQLAECADRLGRPDEATARLRGLLAHPRYADAARAKIRATYAHHLSEVAGERRAVLTAVSSLQSNPSRK